MESSIDNQGMKFDWREGALAQGLRRYRNQEFFEAHEDWEGVWLKCEDPEKRFLQGMIQLTAALHHFKKRNLRGTRSLLLAALPRLAGCPPEFQDIAVGALREEIQAWLRALQQGTPPPDYPEIRILSEANVTRKTPDT